MGRAEFTVAEAPSSYPLSVEQDLGTVMKNGETYAEAGDARKAAECFAYVGEHFANDGFFAEAEFIQLGDFHGADTARQRIAELKK